MAAVLGSGVLGVCGVASAHELKPAWGYANIDERAFYEPSGALLPATQVWPRGTIRDVARDGRDVRLTVFVFTPGMSGSAASHKVDEGDFVDKTIEQRLDIAPRQISYLRYDFCRFNPSNGVVEVCEAPFYLGRPEPTPVPTVTPEPTPGTQPAPPPGPVDADGDGHSPPADCWDQNATVHPGAKEIAGNEVDDDCDGVDAPGRLFAGVKNKFVVSGNRLRVDRLRVVDAPEGARVEVRCSGQRCAFTRRVTTVNNKGEAGIAKFFKRGIRPKVTIDVRVTYPSMVGRLVRFPFRSLDVPNSIRYCLPPDGAKPTRC